MQVLVIVVDGILYTDFFNLSCAIWHSSIVTYSCIIVTSYGGKVSLKTPIIVNVSINITTYYFKI